MIRALKRLVGSLSIIGAIGAVALPVSSANASVVNLSACNLSPLSQPFTRWLDPAWYELAPGGDFESTGGDFESTGWQLSGGARRVAGSDPFAATGTTGSWSLSLPAGASAESPATCVDAAYPTVRFFSSGTGLIAVSVVYGNVTLPAGVEVAAGGWQPSLVMLTDSALVAATQDGSAQVSVRFTTLLGDVRVDDVFVDPWNRS